MGIRTGKQFLEGLKDDRQIWVDGERVKDVTTDPRFEGCAATLAELFDIQHQRLEEMTYPSPTTGAAVGLSFLEPRSADDLATTPPHGEGVDGSHLRNARPQHGLHELPPHRDGLRGAVVRPRRTHPSAGICGTTTSTSARTTSRSPTRWSTPRSIAPAPSSCRPKTSPPAS